MMGRRTRRAVSMIHLTTARGARAYHRSYRGRTPILVLDFDTTSVTVSTSAHSRVTEADVEFARQLVEQAAHFALAVEQMFLGRGAHKNTGVRS